ncbi:MAG: hypothetical protein HDS69_05505 [Bacteroidales bacterium]|nr:hypothetical protein [Bacteroidales bacterium]
MDIDIKKLNELIKEGEQFKLTTVEAHLEAAGFGMTKQVPTMHYLANADKFAVWRQKCIRYLVQYFPKDIALEDFKNLDWEKKLTPPKLYDLIGTLKALRENPTICEVKDLPSNMNNITINQNLTQNQSQTFSLVLYSLKEELKGKEYRELEQILSSNTTREEKKQNIISKLKSFGENVAAGIVATLLTQGLK